MRHLTHIAIFATTVLLAACEVGTKPDTNDEDTATLVPTIVAAPPMAPGQKSYWHGTTKDVNGPTVIDYKLQQEQPSIKVLDFDELTISEPYIFADEATLTYYMTGTGGSMYKSHNLKDWEGPYKFVDLSGTPFEGSTVCVAPEIHKIGKFYYLATSFSTNELVDVIPRRWNVKRTQTVLLRAESPDGPYIDFSRESKCDFVPKDWASIHGTIYQEDGHNYFVFVHEWLQTIDGTINYVELSEDLSHSISPKPLTLFRATENPAAGEMTELGEATFGVKLCGWVSDGPELFRTQSGRLGMLWSSWGVERHEQLVCYSESGTIKGPWVQEPVPLLMNNSGHGMLFRTFDGKLLYLVHHQNGAMPRKPQLWEADDSGDKLVLGKRLEF